MVVFMTEGFFVIFSPPRWFRRLFRMRSLDQQTRDYVRSREGNP